MMKKDNVSVLVSAIGGDIGQAIVKSLKVAQSKIICHGCDVEDNQIGKLFVDSFHIVPSAHDHCYIDAVNTLVLELGVDVFIPASEQEISVLCKSGLMQRLPCNIPVICQDARIIASFGDKLTCMRMLDGNIPIAKYADGCDPESVRNLVAASGFPLVIKERLSRGSKSIKIVHSQDEITKNLKNYDLPLIQEFIDDQFGEFSVGVFSDSKTIDIIAFRRLLGLTGASWFAETSYDQEVIDYARKIADIISPRGSINIQVRKGSRGVQLLEVNPRFSSLTAARAICGFNDVMWSLNLTLNGIAYKEKPVIKNIRFKRFISELIDFGNGFEIVPALMPEKINKTGFNHN